MRLSFVLVSLLLLSGTLAADTVGDITVESSLTTFGPSQLVLNGPYTASASGTLTKIYYACHSSADQEITVGLYKNIAGTLTLVTDSTARVFHTTCNHAMQSVNTVGGTIDAGGEYWLAENSNSNGNGFNALYRATTTGRAASVAYTGGLLPDTYPTSYNVLNGEWSIYAEYTVTGSGAANNPGGSSRGLIGKRR